MSVRIITGDCVESMRGLPDASVQCCVTSPPYWGQRNYGHDDQLGQEATPELYAAALVRVFDEVRRVLREDGVLWLNIGDGYSAGGNGGGGSWGAKRDEREWAGIASRTGYRAAPTGWKRKEQLGLPWLVGREMSRAGWYLRREVIWSKQTANEPPRADRPSGSHETVFLMSRAPSYRYAQQADTQLSVWHIPTMGFSGAHFATMPTELVRRCIASGSCEGDTVLDPFGGAGTTGLVADRLGRNAILCELNPEYVKIAERRIHSDNPLFSQTEVA